MPWRGFVRTGTVGAWAETRDPLAQPRAAPRRRRASRVGGARRASRVELGNLRCELASQGLRLLAKPLAHLQQGPELARIERVDLFEIAQEKPRIDVAPKLAQTLGKRWKPWSAALRRGFAAHRLHFLA
jgi:hypothetical protein